MKVVWKDERHMGGFPTGKRFKLRKEEMQARLRKKVKSNLILPCWIFIKVFMKIYNIIGLYNIKTENKYKIKKVGKTFFLM